ncbi:prophage tail fiber N-terminal domain-containing protein [Escherichia albertii]|nr:prophage tail fiber N-terminal domain-containing protein [Escherichia albertii]
MKIKISGVLNSPLTEVCAGSEIQLKAVTTSNDVIIRAESSYFVGQDGKYNFDVYPGRYDIYIQFSAEVPQKVGRIGVYADSKPGTLEEYLLIDDGGFFKPEALIQFEKDCAAAAASAGAAKTSETNSANSAAASAASASAAEEAANRGGNIDVSDFAKINERNDFTALNYFKLLTTFSGGGLFNASSTFEKLVTFKAQTEFYGDVLLGRDPSGSSKIKCYENLEIYNAKHLSLYSAKIDGITRHPSIAFFSPGSTFEYMKINGEPGDFVEISSRGAKTFKLNFGGCPADGLKFTGKDKIERSLFHTGFLPPAAISVAELPTEAQDVPMFYFVESESKLYLVVGDKKFAVALEDVS